MATSKEIVAPPLDNPEHGPPTDVIGSVTQGGVVPWANLGYIDQQEHVPDLIYPNSIRTYNYMRRDAQIKGLQHGMFMPVRRYKWVVDPNGTPPEVYERFAADVNLPIKGQDQKPRGRSKGRFNWGNFLRHALLGTTYGHMFFEINGEYRRDDSLWHFTQAEERMPHTISDVLTNPNGTLKSIKQSVGLEAPEIEADRLIPFIWEREGGNWLGTSMIREMYKLWVIKDRIIRVNAMSIERNGVGVPVIEAPPNATRGTLVALSQMAQAFKAGESSGGSIPNGAKLTLEGVRGNLPDAIRTWEMCNQEMAKSLLMMFIELGQTRTGSRALGSEFIDYFQLAQESVAIWICETTAEELAEKWLFWNFGDKYDYSPLIDFERNEEPELAIQDLVMMITAGAIHMDPELEEILRSRFMFPALPDEFKPVYYPKNIPSEPSKGDPEQENAEGQAKLEEKSKEKTRPPKEAKAAEIAAAPAASGVSASPTMLPGRRTSQRIW